MFPTTSDALFPVVFQLGESEKEWLGVLPHAAWADYAQAGHLLALLAKHSGELLGYCAFRLPRNDVVIAHLVVAPDARGRGAARLMVDLLSTRYAERRGIKASCRRDYPANAMWPSLGFVPIGERPGRGTEGHLLTTWWRDHGHPNLLTWHGSPSAVTSVVLDANVFIDLHGEVATNTASAVREWLALVDDRVQLLATPELLVEIDRRGDSAGRATLRRHIEAYPVLSVDMKRVTDYEQALRTASGSLPGRLQDVSDIRHVAYAAAAGVPVVLTRDDAAMKRLAVPAWEELGVRILTPQELITYLDEQERSETYWPAALMGTGYTLKEATATERTILETFHDHSSGEKKKDYVERLRRLAAARPQSHRRIYFDPDGNPVALAGCEPAADDYEISVLRLKPSAMQSTLAAQIVDGLRALAREQDKGLVRVTEPHLHPLFVDALMADGYRPSGSAWVAPTVRRLATITEVTEYLLPQLARSGIQVDPPPDGGTEALRAWCAGLERTARPLRISDAPIDSLLVPIRAAFASSLFGHPADLFGRTDELGISVEHVYFRAGRSGELPPARILWYVSGKSHGQVFAMSDLIEVVDDTPKALYARFRRFGVYTFDQVAASVNRAGRTRALRFTHTELFDRGLSLNRLREMAESHGHRLTLRSPHRLPQVLFEQIVREGRHG